MRELSYLRFMMLVILAAGQAEISHKEMRAIIPELCRELSEHYSDPNPGLVTMLQDKPLDEEGE